MADYKRMVSYMYQYENGVKKKNVGFARVEAKDGQCKITLHMQLLGQLDSIFPTYIMQRKHSDLELIYLGDTQLKNQVMDSKLVAEELNIMDSGYSLSDMGGLLLFLNDKVFFATEWDDKPVIAKEVLEALKPKAEKGPRAEQEQEYEQELSAEPESMSDLELESKQIPEVNATARVITEQGIATEYQYDTEPAITPEEELLIPKYMLPRGYKTIERLKRPVDYIRVSYPRDLGVNDTPEAMNQAEKEETVAEEFTAAQDITTDEEPTAAEEFAVDEEFTTEEQFAEEEQFTEAGDTVAEEELTTVEAFAEDGECAADEEEEVLRQTELEEQKNEEEKPLEEAADP